MEDDLSQEVVRSDKEPGAEQEGEEEGSVRIVFWRRYQPKDQCF